MSVHLIANSIWHNPGNRGRRLRKGFAAVAWQWHKRASGSVRTLRLVNGMRFNAYPDCVVSSSLIYADWPEHDELMLLRRSLMQSNIVIDVGANVGHVSLLLADLVGARNIVAFEPAPRAFGRLTENWILNNFPTDKLFNMAVGASPGAVFIESDEHPTTTLQVSEEPAGARSIRVPLVRLDDYRHEWKGYAVGLLKVDVEGYEPAVFEGAIGVLAEDRPRLIMFESLSGSIDSRIASILTAHRYAVFQLDESGVPDFSRSSAQNLFAVPAEIVASSGRTI
jgi:FkbM family methyltransferase